MTPESEKGTASSFCILSWNSPRLIMMQADDLPNVVPVRVGVLGLGSFVAEGSRLACGLSSRFASAVERVGDKADKVHLPHCAKQLHVDDPRRREFGHGGRGIQYRQALALHGYQKGMTRDVSMCMPAVFMVMQHMPWPHLSTGGSPSMQWQILCALPKQKSFRKLAFICRGHLIHKGIKGRASYDCPQVSTARLQVTFL